jgi:hypothetical protein
VLVQIGELFVRFVRERQLALPAVRLIVFVIFLNGIFLPAVAAPDAVALGNGGG